MNNMEKNQPLSREPVSSGNFINLIHSLLILILVFLGAPFLVRAANLLWQPLPLITQSGLNAGNGGGEGCQVIQNFAIDSTGQFLMMGTDEIGRASCRGRV